MTHTPGPWTAKKNGCWFDIIADSGDDIVGDSGLLGSSEEDKANAHLIAAAPDLLEAGKVLFQLASLFNRNNDAVWVVARDMWLAAVAKAEGKT